MDTIIDLSSEVLIDRSGIANPYLRLLVTAVGEQLVDGSPWVAIGKEIAALHEPLRPLLQRVSSPTAA